MNSRNRDAVSVIFAGVAASAVGALFYNVLPLYLGAAQDFRGLSNSQIGLIGTVFFSGFTATTAIGFYWIRRWSWRWTALAATVLAAAGLALAGQSPAYGLLLGCVFVAGGALSMVYGIGTTALGDTSNPARWYGVKIAAEAMTGAVLLAILPTAVLSRWGFEGLAWVLAGVLAVLAPVLLWLPRHELASQEEASVTEGATTNRTAVWLGLLGCLLFMNGETVAWSFIERMGNDAGFDAAVVGRLLAVTLVVALTGSFIAAALGGRFGTLKPIIIAHIAYFLAAAALFQTGSFPTFATGACLVMFSVGLGLPFAVTAVAELDRDGRFVVLTVPAIGIGMLIAPGAAGWLSAAGDFAPVLLFGLFNLGGSLAAFILALRIGNREITSTRETNP